jgi:hypothetical protein
MFMLEALFTFMFFYVWKKIALAWMLSKENCSHCPGGILADDQVTSHFSYHIQIAFDSSSYQVPLCLAIDFL